MGCKRVALDKRRVCIGDLNKRIILHDRNITGVTSGVDFDETLSNPKKVWAGLKTVHGEDIFDGANVIGVATHKFYIRFIASLTSETFVEFNGKYFKILDTQNLEENNEFIELRCSVRGDKTKAANLK